MRENPDVIVPKNNRTDYRRGLKISPALLESARTCRTASKILVYEEWMQSARVNNVENESRFNGARASAPKALNTANGLPPSLSLSLSLSLSHEALHTIPTLLKRLIY